MFVCRGDSTDYGVFNEDLPAAVMPSKCRKKQELPAAKKPMHDTAIIPAARKPSKYKKIDCGFPGCTKVPSFNFYTEQASIFCKAHR